MWRSGLKHTWVHLPSYCPHLLPPSLPLWLSHLSVCVCVFFNSHPQHAQPGHKGASKEDGWGIPCPKGGWSRTNLGNILEVATEAIFLTPPWVFPCCITQLYPELCVLSLSGVQGAQPKVAYSTNPSEARIWCLNQNTRFLLAPAVDGCKGAQGLRN